MKKNVLITALLFIAVMGSKTTFAQTASKLQFGVKGGINLSGLYGNDVDDTKSKLGFCLGATMDYKLDNTTTYLFTGLEYIEKGVKSKGSESVSMNLGYLQLPIHIGLKSKVDEKTSFILHAGPYFAYALKGTMKQGGVSVNLFDYTDAIRRYDIGAGAFVGFDFSKKIRLGLGVDVGFINTEDNSKIGYIDGSASARNINACLSVGYLF